MPLMDVRGKARKRKRKGWGLGTLTSTAVAVNKAIKTHQPLPPVGYKPLGGNYSAVPVYPPISSRAAFSYAMPGRVIVHRQDLTLDTRSQSPWPTAAKTGLKTAGEVMQEKFEKNMYETSSGVVVAEMPGDYGEEYFGDESNLGGWMDRNDRSSAATVLDESMKEYGGGMGMDGFSMGGLASYEGYTAATGTQAIAIVAQDLLDCMIAITGNGARLSSLTWKTLTTEMGKKGYPAAEVQAMVTMASLFLPQKYKDALAGKTPSTGTTTGTTTTPPAQSTAGLPSDFVGSVYLSLNPDVAAAVAAGTTNAERHWLDHGRYESRQYKVAGTAPHKGSMFAGFPIWAIPAAGLIAYFLYKQKGAA